MANGGKRPGAGRKPGSPNKKSLEIEEKLSRLGCDPIEGMARIALDETAPLKIRATMYSELAQYVTAKRKAVEVSGPGGSKLDITLTRIDAHSPPA